MTTGDRVIGYVRVSTREQGVNGVGLDAQREAIERECEYRGWQLLRVEEDVQSGRSIRRRAGEDFVSSLRRGRRAGLARAVTTCRRGEASAVVAAKLDRLTRSVVDLADLLEDARGSYNVVALDFGLDISSPQGELVANVLASVGQWERRIIGERTRAAMAVVKKKGTKSGKPIGRPRTVTVEIRKRVQRERRAGHTLQQIADALMADSVPTGHGGTRWYPSSVRALLV